MKSISRNIIVASMVLVSALSLGSVANAVTAPDVNLNSAPTTPTSPFGAFKLSQCDGPAKLNDPSTHQIKNAAGNWVTDTNWKPGFNADGSPFRACDFNGLMVQIQFLINAMLVIGVLAALIGFAYAGFLYITGTQANLKKAHNIFPKVLVGFILMLTAWFIVYQILNWLAPGSAYLK